MSAKHRVNELNVEIHKRNPVKPSEAPNHFYITKKTNVSSYAKQIEDLMNNKYDQVYVHGLGSSLNRALTLALEVQKRSAGSIQFHMRTSTVKVTDDLFPLSDEAEMGMRQRPLSAVHILMYRA